MCHNSFISDMNWPMSLRHIVYEVNKGSIIGCNPGQASIVIFIFYLLVLILA